MQEILACLTWSDLTSAGGKYELKFNGARLACDVLLLSVVSILGQFAGGQ